MRAELARLASEYEGDEHEHHDHHGCEEEHEHHHHDDGEEEHEHHHHHDGEGGACCCHHDHEGHEHHHHGHHHADDVFTSWGIETTHKFTKEELESALAALSDERRYGTVLRAKGIVSGTEGWLHFDYVPSEPDVRTGSAGVTGRLCVIGCKINEAALKELFKA